ncbi:MAG TPA: MFS transporter [Steroidobacteraceae bacterium]|nr:MFS transporter [Steroidobacteraceae bacterium]
MRSALIATWTLLFGMALLMLGAGLQGTLVGLRASLEGFPTFVAGFVMAAYYLGYLGGSVVAPRLVSSVGHVRVFAALTSLASVMILAQGAIVDPVTWTLLRVGSGFCFAGIYVVAESWLNDRATNENRGQLLALYMVICYAGLGGGQLLLNVADPRSTLLFILVSVLISVALVPMALTAGPAPEFHVPQRVGMRELYRVSPLGVVGVATAGAVSGSLFALGAIYGADQGMTTWKVSFFMAVAILAAAVTQLPVGRLSDRVDRRKILALVCILGAASAAAALFATGRSTSGFLVAVAAFGGLSLTLYSLSLAHANDYLTPQQMVGASSTLILVNGAGAFVGPLIVSALMQAFDSRAFFAMLVAMQLALALFALYRMTRRAAIPVEQKTPYVGTPPGTNSSGEMVGHATEEIVP